ncbi:MAG: diaminopimelate decarboxylase [Deltaproteobacteria bacterium]|nr:diaminopimelate decarboxylase [Deltaproteobacteria bacterium]
MHHFHYKKNELHCEEVPLQKIAEEVGTPTYVYSSATFGRHFRVFDAAFQGISHLTCFAMKTNSNIALLRAVSKWGGGVDIVSGGELFRALTAGVPAHRIVYSGVGKTEAEMEYALRSDILLFNVESADELLTLANVAKRIGQRAPVAIRVNPDINPKTHPYISTGLKKSKFGIQIKESLKLYEASKKYDSLIIRGVSCHIGSQITQLKPFIDTVRRLRDFVQLLKQKGFDIQYIDLGGGLGIPYKNETPPSPAQYAGALKKELKDMRITLLLEPGRVIAGNAGILLTRLLYRKKQGNKNFVIVDAAMNDLIRPALYGSYHEILPVKKRGGRKERVNVVGPVCESADFFAENRPLPVLPANELLSIMSAGAYGFTMASNYNSRLRAAEVLVHGNEFYVVRQREEYKDLLKGEHVPKFLV